MSDTATIVLIAVLVVVVAVVVTLIVRRQRYKKALKDRGWHFDPQPPIEAVHDHQAPPFGLGFDRSIDEAISGTTSSGVPFRVFEYAYTDAGPKFDERLASLHLPLALPDVFVSSGGVRSGVDLAVVNIDPRLQVRAANVPAARAVLDQGLLDAIAVFGQAGYRVDLSIDGTQLVAIGAPKKPEELQAYLDALAAVAAAVNVPALAGYAITPRPPGLGFYGRPDWVLVGRDDNLISTYGLTTAGFGHKTEKVVRGHNDGLPIDAFIHRWKTTRTESYTDSEGRAQTRTVTDSHSETVCIVTMSFAFPLISIGGGWGGERVRFESEEFNDRFKVKTKNPKFAYDVIHPRTMEFLVAANPPHFRIEDRQMRFAVTTHDQLMVGYCADFAHEFFGRVPSFVWDNLGVAQPTFRRAIES